MIDRGARTSTASEPEEVVYIASPTARKFHRDDKFVRGLIGPIGSGKSVACCWEIIRKACKQAPNHLGIRRSRWAIIRNTYRELVDTTMETFFDWFPKELGFWRAQDIKFTLKRQLPDGTHVELEVLFRALDRPDDVKKLLSLELTGGWINEAREIPKAVLDMLMGRVGRYPSKREGGASWYGVIMDTNPPDTDHWWYKVFEEDRPEGWSCFNQPSGIGPDAENTENLPVGYYKNMMTGKDQAWIDVYIHGKYGFVMDGKPVFPEYKDDVHHTDEDIVVPTNSIIYIGIDFGLTPAATFGYQTASNRWVIFDELVTEDMGAATFAKLLKRHINRYYSNNTLEIYGDPAGEQRSQADENTPFQVLDANGIVAWPTYTNDPIIRREAVAGTMTRMDFSGNTGFLLGPKAIMTRKALAGGYKYKRMQVSGSDRFMDKPDKNRYSHVADSLQYLLLGAGEGDNVIGGYSNTDPDYSLTNRQVI